MMAVMHNGRRFVHQRIACSDDSKESRKIITTTRCGAGAESGIEITYSAEG
jgi:hypothetical protein